MVKKVYVIESQSQYDGGHTLEVFDNEQDARTYIENQKDFRGWCEDDNKESIGRDKDDFFYCYDEFELKK